MNKHKYSILGLALFASATFFLAPMQGAPAKDPVLPRQTVAHFLEVEAIRLENPAVSITGLEDALGKKRAYRLSEVNLYLKALGQASAAPTIREQVALNGYQGPKTFPWVHLRRSAADVLASEDPTLAIPGDKTFDDLDGALFSFSRDFLQNTDTWSSQAALIAPFSWSTGHTLRSDTILALARFGLVPSASLFRVSTSGDPAEEIDLKTYRAGVFAKFESGSSLIRTLTLRGFGAYTADEQHDSGTWAGEFELEPQADWRKWLRLGYRTIVIGKPEKMREDEQDTALLAYQARALLRGEYGSVNNEGVKFVGQEFEYARLGPVLQFDLKPFFFRRLNLSFRYQFLPTVSGEDVAEMTGLEQDDQLFTADAEWLLIDPEQSPGRRVSLKASYIKGGVGPLQEKTETLLIGLGAAF